MIEGERRGGQREEVRKGDRKTDRQTDRQTEKSISVPRIAREARALGAHRTTDNQPIIQIISPYTDNKIFRR